MDDICGVAALRSSHSRQFTPHWRCFHSHHGSNIVLCDNDSTAFRKASFANGIAFSRCPLMPGEIFCVEIEKNEAGWSGSLRIGLTTFSPDSYAPIPAYGLPDLVEDYDSWLVAVKKPATPPSAAARTAATPGAVVAAAPGAAGGDCDLDCLVPAEYADALTRAAGRGWCGMRSRETSGGGGGGCVGRVSLCRDRAAPQGGRASPLPSMCARAVCDGLAAPVCVSLPGGERRGEERREGTAQCSSSSDQCSSSSGQCSSSSAGHCSSSSAGQCSSSSAGQCSPPSAGHYSSSSADQPSSSSGQCSSSSAVHCSSSSDQPSCAFSDALSSSSAGQSSTSTRVCRAGRLATDVGSRLGVMFVPSAESGLRTADMHVLINGEDQGAVCGGIPHGRRSLYAVVDVYGATKQVRIVQLYGVQPLMSKCRDVILEHMRCESVWQLPLPSTLKHYMAFNA